ncbi:MAG: hypothetical protein ACTSSP_04015 [Candidatus Asgardarchaeia archaeon]
MCIDTKLSMKEERKAKEKLPDTFTAYKLVRVKNVVPGQGVYYAPILQIGAFETGWNEAPTRKRMRVFRYRFGKADFRYLPYYHCFKTKYGASRYKNMMFPYPTTRFVVVKVQIPKKYIRAIGDQDGYMCIVTKKMWMPDPEDKTSIVG